MSLEMLNRTEQTALHLARGLSKIGLLILIAFAACTLVDGLSRSFLSYPIDAVRDLGGLTTAVAISCCFPQAFLEGSNIVISFIDGLAGKRGTRILEAGAAVITTVVVILFAWEFLHYARELAQVGEMSALLEIPVAPFWYVVAANLWLTVLAQLLVTARTFTLRPPPVPAEPHSGF